MRIGSIDSAAPPEGQAGCEVRYTLLNDGTAEAGPTLTAVEATSGEVEFSAEESDSQLAAGQSRQESVVVPLPCTSLTVTVTADATNTQVELDEANNSATRTFP